MNIYIKTILLGTLFCSASFAFAVEQTVNENTKIVVAADQTMERSMGSSTKTGRKNMAHKGLFDSKVMDTNSDGMISKEEYTNHHDQVYGKMKQTNGNVSIKDMNAAMNHGTTKANKLQPNDMNH